MRQVQEETRASDSGPIIDPPPTECICHALLLIRGAGLRNDCSLATLNAGSRGSGLSFRAGKRR